MATTARTLLVIGGCGELGWETVRAACAGSSFTNILASYCRTEPSDAQRATPRTEWVQLDCGNHVKVARIIEKSRPRAIIYCAVPKHGGASGKGGDDVRRGIVDDVVHAAIVAQNINSLFIVLSTDLVFDGTLTPGKMYAETDPVSPTNNVSTCSTQQCMVLGVDL